jgi:WD40 repeat protein
MAPRRVQLVMQILIFLLATLLGVASSYLTNTAHASVVLEWIQRSSLPLAGITTVMIVVFMIAQHQQEARASRPAWNSARSPFPGLEAFAESDAGVFFGRDSEISELVELLHPHVPASARRSIVVTGPSGVGKTSLVQAGLLPRLANRRDRWLVIPAMVPGDAPMDSLARALASVSLDVEEHNVRSVLSGDVCGLARVAEMLRRQCRMPSASVLVVIDQAEELMTTVQAHERDVFLETVSESLSADRRLWVISTLRSDFLTGLLSDNYAHLFRTPLTVGALNSAQLVEAIERPAAKAGIRFDPQALVSIMACETGNGLGLPLLAYLLQELYMQADAGKTINISAYRALGGVAGALTRQGDRVTAELDRAGLGDRVFPTLLKFVTFAGGAPARRRVLRSQLDHPEQLVTEAFIRARLIVSDAYGSDAMLEIVHEAMFQYWAPFRQEIEAHGEQLRARTDFERWSSDWIESGHQQSYLLQGDRLKRATRWANDSPDALASLPLVAEFLDVSRSADRATMERLADSIASSALATMENDPVYSLLLAFTAVNECARTLLARRALISCLCVSKIRSVFPVSENFLWRVAWSPDENRLAASSADGTAVVWDIGTNSRICQLNGPIGEVHGLAWSPDSNYLATCSADGSARIWNIDEGRMVRGIESHERAIGSHERIIRDIAWSTDGKRIATASEDSRIKVWNADDGTEQLVLAGHNGPVGAIAWSPDGTRLASASADRTCRVWDAASGRELFVMRGHTRTIQAIRWSPDGHRIATASADSTARIWAASDGAELLVLHGHTGEVRDVAWRADGKYVATGSDDVTLRVWDAAEGFTTDVVKNGRAGVRGVDWSPHSGRIATSSTDGRTRVIDIRPDMELLILRNGNSTFWDVAWSPDGGRIASVQSESLCIWDAQDGKRLLHVYPGIGQLHCIAWSPDSLYLATSSADGKAGIWDAHDGTLLRTLTGHRDSVRSIAWSPEGNRLATASADQTARIWNAEDGKQLLLLKGHAAPLRGVAWHPTGRQIATASSDRTAHIWDARGGKSLMRLHGHDGTLQDLHWSPDGSRIATASVDRTVRLWDTNDGSILSVLTGHDDTIRAVEWSPDGNRIATASYDRTARIWDAASGTELTPAGFHAHRTECLSWAPDGSRIVVGSQDKTARVWKTSVESEKLVKLAQKRVFRTLTLSERSNLMLPGS